VNLNNRRWHTRNQRSLSSAESLLIFAAASLNVCVTELAFSVSVLHVFCTHFVLTQ
jgi:hypothetical protein